MSRRQKATEPGVAIQILIRNPPVDAITVATPFYKRAKGMTYPETYKYTKEHEWVRVEGDKGTIGITDHAQHELGDIVFVDLPKAGTQVKKGHTFGSVESVKAVSDIYAPVSGEVLEPNDLLARSPKN